MKIFVLSLLKDYQRRNNLRLKFPENFNNFKFFWGNTGIVDCINVSENMSCSEINCALGHLNILNHTALIEDNFSLILEDDIIGCDKDIEKIKIIYSELPMNSILIAGCLPSLKSLNYVYGIKVVSCDCYKIPKFYYRFLVFACAYVVDKKASEFLIKKQIMTLNRADDWGVLLKGFDNVYFTNILRHPEDFSYSNIETERSIFKSKNIFLKIFDIGVMKSISYSLSKYIGVLLAFFKKYKKVL